MTLRYVAGLLCCLMVAPAFAEDDPGLDATDWQAKGQARLALAKAVKPNNRKARNIILFVGDGMGPAAVTAARIHSGQQAGGKGEDNFLSFEDPALFPWSGLSKTYTTDSQIPDSAGTATAMMTGSKTRSGVVGLDGAARRGQCDGPDAHRLVSLLEMAEDAGVATGIVSTTRITHATPAATYAHVPERDWEDDTDIPDYEVDPGCVDIARQLVGNPHGDGVNVILGGGRANFFPVSQDDPEHAGKTGRRGDGRDLIKAWLAANAGATYVWNADQFNGVSADHDGKLLGLFEPSHMQFEADRAQDPGGEPSLAEMTAKAINLLQHQSGRKGFFLMVEGGRIDHALHFNNAARALSDTAAFADAVKVATELTNKKDTLIIVTADHSHTLTIAGYASRGNPILGLSDSARFPGQPTLAKDGKPYTTLGFANGPQPLGKTERENLLQVDTKDINFQQQALVPFDFEEPYTGETHGGEDVAVYARGPRAHYLTGVFEQSYIFHVMKDAAAWVKD